VSYIIPQWSVPAHVKAYTTTRSGGVSRDQYGSMNLGLHVGDDRHSVAKNRNIIKSELNLPSEPVWLEQVHSTNIVEASAPIECQADGAFSKKADIVCTVMTADCLPLLLTNVGGNQVAAIHVGWRGMANGIIEKAISLFDTAPERIVAWAGPCIGPDKFEIGLQVREQLGGCDEAYQSLNSDKLYANLYLLCKQRLKALGVSNYTYTKTCTHSDESRFYSYRRDGQCGRMASLIWIEPTE